MNSIDFVKEKPSKSWWPSLLWTFIFAMAGAAIIDPIVNLVMGKTLYTEQIGGLFTFIGAILLTVVYTVFFKKRSIRALGFKKEDFGKNYGLGLVIGLLLVCLVVGTATLFGGFSIELKQKIEWLWIGVAALGFFIQGLAEEVIMRGYLFTEVASHKGRLWGLLVSSIAFTALHAANPGMTVLPILNLFIFGLFFGLLFWLTDNIWIVGAGHSIWNFTLGPVLGILVSGQAFPASIFTTIPKEGMDLISGGNFGVEGSIFTSLFGLLGCLIIWRQIQKKEKK